MMINDHRYCGGYHHVVGTYIMFLQLCVLQLTGSGGAVFQGSVQTPMVRADSRHDLR